MNTATSWRFACFGILLTVALGSCTVNKDLMFKTDRDFVFDQPDIDSTNKEYRISPNDFLNLQVFSNRGTLILEYTTSGLERQRYSGDLPIAYQVDVDGTVDLPAVGRQHLAGMTISEAQDFLEKQYTVQFNNPYVILRAVNRRIMVFPGAGGEAQVIPLVNPNVNVIEAIALAGGIAPRGNASKVKLIRRVDGEQKVYLMDLSTIEGIQFANVTVQAGDVIYVEPNPLIAFEVIQEVQPLLTFFTAVAIVYSILAR